MQDTTGARETKWRKARRHNAFRQWARQGSNLRPSDYESRKRWSHLAELASLLSQPVSFCRRSDTITDAATDTHASHGGEQ